MLTLLVPLSTPGVDFEGGGTGFWSSSAAPASGGPPPPNLVLRPPAGTAMLWRGNVMHAGMPVVTGKRYAFVVSFNLKTCRESSA
eukprot:4959376-Prymnesium_polylepis.1